MQPSSRIIGTKRRITEAVYPMRLRTDLSLSALKRICKVQPLILKIQHKEWRIVFIATEPDVLTSGVTDGKLAHASYAGISVRFLVIAAALAYYTARGHELSFCPHPKSLSLRARDLKPYCSPSP